MQDVAVIGSTIVQPVDFLSDHKIVSTQKTKSLHLLHTLLNLPYPALQVAIMIAVPEREHVAALASKPVVADPPAEATSTFVHEMQRFVTGLK